MLIVIVGIISFGLGRLSMQPSVALTSHPLLLPVETAQAASRVTADTARATTQAQTGEKKYVGSKNSNKYHLPWCGGAARIAEKNKVWFASKEAAAAAGYTPATNCKGI
jgi:hypothetical protein